ncbi:ribbon-helix-helix domain-containing protein [Halomonas stenophila]|uniref:Chaperonin GroEL (HSP60 family) n=1 Tax=Halomonas stenophila TaxID=795312 RepID=A0A7W5HLU6_9GAMM|nr:ribbon-helix-helix domain-containing protein [Halomonas stenophila]MBB3231971.1 chaperonin GroEL (HSP60 family) [Halomonas stenophila]
MAGWSYAQAQQAWQLKEEGYDFDEISVAMGVRATTAQKLVSRWEARLSIQAVWHHGLPVRIVNHLKENNIDSLESLQSVLAEGRLQKGMVPGIGAASIEQIRTWLESRNLKKECSEADKPVVVHLSPAMIEALDALAITEHEDRSEIIKRLILEADEHRKR